MAQDIIKEILNDFDAHSKADWEAQALKDLKGAPLEKLNWEINDEIKQAAFYAESDLSALDHGALKSHNPDWQIGEHYFVEDYKATNKILLADLMHGLNAPVFTFKEIPNPDNLKDLFNGIGLEYIHTHFSEASFELFSSWNKFFENEQKMNSPAYFSNKKSHFLGTTKSVLIDCTKFYQSTSHIHLELKHAIDKVKELLKADKSNYRINQLHFKFYVDNSYLASVAKLRAFKLLFLDLLSSYDLKPTLPFISVELAPDAYGEDQHDNLINATAMAMSAVIGGANHLIVRPTEDTSTSKRLARNVQLILKHESGLHKVADPAQGSYYIESLTSKLVNWVKQ